jgi:hypothetical protein
MDKVQNTLLNNTLSIFQMAREAASLKGSMGQVERLEPVVDHLKSLLSTSEAAKVTEQPAGIFAQQDFATLLNVINSEKSGHNVNERLKEKNNMIYAMAAGGMNDLEIARHLGMTRDEVGIVLNLSRGEKSGGTK